MSPETQAKQQGPQPWLTAPIMSGTNSQTLPLRYHLGTRFRALLLQALPYFPVSPYVWNFMMLHLPPPSPLSGHGGCGKLSIGWTWVTSPYPSWKKKSDFHQVENHPLSKREFRPWAAKTLTYSHPSCLWAPSLDRNTPWILKSLMRSLDPYHPFINICSHSWK